MTGNLAKFCGGALLLVGLVSSSGADEPETPADVVLLNGTLVTVDPDLPRAQGLAARNRRIVAVGSSDTLRRFVGPQTRVIDLGGRLAIPGFIEGHGHLASLGEARLSLDLSQAGDWNEVVEVVARAAAKTAPG